MVFFFCDANSSNKSLLRKNSNKTQDPSRQDMSPRTMASVIMFLVPSLLSSVWLHLVSCCLLLSSFLPLRFFVPERTRNLLPIAASKPPKPWPRHSETPCNWKTDQAFGLRMPVPPVAFWTPSCGASVWQLVVAWFGSKFDAIAVARCCFLASCSLSCPLFSDTLPLLSAGVGGYIYRQRPVSQLTVVVRQDCTQWLHPQPNHIRHGTPMTSSENEAQIS